MAGPSVELLQHVPLFAELEPKELKRLSGSFKEHTFAPGEAVVAEGDHVSRFFVIESGEAAVKVHGDERGRLGPGTTSATSR